MPHETLTQLAGGPHPLLGADALKAIHLVHAGASCRARVGGALIDVWGGTEGEAWEHGPCGEADPWGAAGPCACHSSPDYKAHSYVCGVNHSA